VAKSKEPFGGKKAAPFGQGKKEQEQAKEGNKPAKKKAK
jgi:hypothetical protein